MTQEGSAAELPPLPAAASPKQKTLDRMLGASHAAAEPKAEVKSEAKPSTKGSKAIYDESALKPNWEPGKECVDRSLSHCPGSCAPAACPTRRSRTSSRRLAKLRAASRSSNYCATSCGRSSPTVPPTSSPPSISPRTRHAAVAQCTLSSLTHCAQLAPAYEGLELGIGESILMKAVADSTGRTLAMVKSSFQELGDLGTAHT